MGASTPMNQIEFLVRQKTTPTIFPQGPWDLVSPRAPKPQDRP